MKTAESTTPLWGCAAIANAIGLSPRATFHLLENKRLPARKVGGKWVADPVVLRRFLAGEEASVAIDA